VRNANDRLRTPSVRSDAPFRSAPSLSAILGMLVTLGANTVELLKTDARNITLESYSIEREASGEPVTIRAELQISTPTMNPEAMGGRRWIGVRERHL
jgi:hypothetical protein